MKQFTLIFALITFFGLSCCQPLKANNNARVGVRPTNVKAPKVRPVMGIASGVRPTNVKAPQVRPVMGTASGVRPTNVKAPQVRPVMGIASGVRPIKGIAPVFRSPLRKSPVLPSLTGRRDILHGSVFRTGTGGGYGSGYAA